MAVSADRTRALALSLDGAYDAPHFDRTGFRTKRKMFATLGPTGLDLNLMFTPDLRDHYCEMAPEVFSPVPGGWGLKGATKCDLQKADEGLVLSALIAAHGLAVPK